MCQMQKGHGSLQTIVSYCHFPEIVPNSSEFTVPYRLLFA